MRYFFLLAAWCMAVSCATPLKTSNTHDSSGVISRGARDGSSFETAIVAKSVPEEYDWVRKQYPGYQMIRQSLVFDKKKKPYDILRIQTQDGSKKDVYFDISSFFGKF